MNELELIENWGEQKCAGTYRRLQAGRVVEFEFFGEYGHPSSYGYVRFDAQPRGDLLLEFDAEWPKEFDATYTNRIMDSIGEAVLDALWATYFPYRGCRLRLIDFKWDVVGGSEVSVYKATLGAMQRLIAEGEWEYVTGRHRHYDE